MILNSFSEFVHDQIEAKNLAPIKSRLAEMSAPEIADALKEVRPQDLPVVYRLLAKPVATEVFDMLDVSWQSDLIQALTGQEAAALLRAIEPEDRVHLLDELPARVAKRLLASLPKEQREVSEWLMGYEDGTVGRIMSPSFVDAKDTMTAAQAIERIRHKTANSDMVVHSVYVTKGARELEGVVSLSALVTARPDQKVGELVPPGPPPEVRTDEDQERAARLLQQVEAVELPVVDKEGRLVGVFTADEAMDVLREEVTDDMYDKVGLLDLTQRESDRSAGLIRGSFGHWLAVRAPFLLITLAGGMIAGVVIDAFEDILEAVVATAIFIPVIMDMGGNVGTQSSTIFTRGAVLGQINMKRFFWHWGRETLFGFGMAVLLGVLGGFVAGVWQGMPELGLAVGVSLTLTITIATALGFLVPFVLIKMGFDQAAGADPIITTVKDITGLAIYFASVSLLMPHIIAAAG